MSYRRTRATFLKEIRHIVRDPRSLGMALGIPVLLLILFGFALSLDVDRIPTLVYDADNTSESRELIARFAGSRYFAIHGYVNEYRTIEKEIDAGTILMGIAIPQDYGDRVNSGRAADVQILLDGSDSNTASIARGYAESVIRAHDTELKNESQLRRAGTRLQPPIDARPRVLYNETLESRNYIVPGLIAVILMIIAALLTSLTIAREWEMGTMEQLLSTPLRPSELVLGKMLAFFLIGITDIVITVSVGVIVFDVPLRGSILLLALVSCIFLTGALFWGIFISAIAKNQTMAFQIGILSSFLPAFLLSGFIYAIENMPAVIQAITYIFPARYFITVLKGIFLKGVGIEVLWLPILLLVVYAAVIFTAATRKVRTRLA